MRRIFILLFFCAAYSAADDGQSGTCLNALGWDSGIAYRRYLQGGFFLGASLNGGTSKFHNQADASRQESDNDNETAYKKDQTTGLDYSIGINCQMGKEIIRRKWISVRFLLCPVYTYKWSDTWGTATPNVWHWFFSAGGFAGFEPSFTVLQRFTFGTRFGIKGTYSWSRHNMTSAENTNNQLRNKYDVNIIGTDFFADMQLFGYYEF